MKFPKSGETLGILACILALGITFLALWVLTNVFGNANAIPGMIFIGALLVPISGLIFFFESNAFKNISIFDVMSMFLLVVYCHLLVQ